MKNMKRPDLSKLKHSLVNSPMHFYTEVMDDGTEVLRHIRVQQKVYEVPADGITIDTVPDNSVGSPAIIDGSIQSQDLSDEVKDSMITDADRVTQEDLEDFVV